MGTSRRAGKAPRRESDEIVAVEQPSGARRSKTLTRRNPSATLWALQQHTRNQAASTRLNGVRHGNRARVHFDRCGLRLVVDAKRSLGDATRLMGDC